MNHLSEEQLNRPLAELVMSADDKSRIRRILEAQISLETRRSLRSVRRFAPAFVAAVLVIGGAGVAYACRDSLPGDPLYPVRVAITEPAQGLLIRGDDERLDWEMDVLQQRLDDEEYAILLEDRAEQDDASHLETELQHIGKEKDDILVNSAPHTSIGPGNASQADIESELKELEKQIGQEEGFSPDGE